MIYLNGDWMKRLLLIPMMFIEIILLFLNWIVAFINPRLGEKFMHWNMRILPNKEQYDK